MDQYNKKVMNYFLKPKNVGVIKNASGVGRIDNRICGDSLYVYIKVEKNKKKEEIIKDIKFKSYGCVANIATSVVITEIAKGKSLKEAKKITNKEVIKRLGFLPKQKIHCSILAVDGLKRAIEDYEKKK